MQYRFDPLNATGTSLNSSSTANHMKEGNLEDEQMRMILDNIDVKIGQSIEEKEIENNKMITM